MQKIEAELSSQTINLCGKPMSEKESEKWLGDQIHCLGNDQSVITTVKKRYGVAMSTIMDIKNIMEDTRTSVTGGLMSSIQMYELCVIPYILNNCDVWDNVPKEAIDILDKIQTAFYCYLFNTPRKGTPHAGLLWESGGTCMKLRILKKQLNFYHHLKNLDGQCLAKSITDIQSRNNYPGLIKVCEEKLLNLGLSHLKPCELSKQSWSRAINNKIKDENRSMILNIIKGYKKLDYFSLKKEEFCMKDYLKTMNIKDARLFFRTRVSLVPGIKFQYKSDPKFSASLWSCDLCEKAGEYNLDSFSHVLWCPELAQLRKDRDINDDQHLVNYVRDAMRIREEASSN